LLSFRLFDLHEYPKLLNVSEVGYLDSAAAALVGAQGFIDADQDVNGTLVKKRDGAFQNLARDRENAT
jgi:hypothetical protein